MQFTKEEAEFIRSSFDGFRVKLTEELGRHPGGEIDDLDTELVRQLVNKLRNRGRTGFRIAHYEPGYRWGAGKPIWINGGQNVLLWIRNQQFRPKVAQVEAEMVRLGMLEETVAGEGHVVDQRRAVTAPPDYTIRSIAAGSGGLLGMPEAPIPTEMPSWIDDFPSRGNPDEDRIIVNCLLHMSEAKARETIERIVADRFAETRRRGEAETVRAKAEQVRETRRAGRDGASVVMAEIHRRRHNAMQEA
jgi:hypothetical protein